MSNRVGSSEDCTTVTGYRLPTKADAGSENLIKAFQDCLAERYGFNDRDIYRWEIEKLIVPKGKEFAAFGFHPLISAT